MYHPSASCTAGPRAEIRVDIQLLPSGLSDSARFVHNLVPLQRSRPGSRLVTSFHHPEHISWFLTTLTIYNEHGARYKHTSPVNGLRTMHASIRSRMESRIFRRCPRDTGRRRREGSERGSMSAGIPMDDITASCGSMAGFYEPSDSSASGRSIMGPDRMARVDEGREHGVHRILQPADGPGGAVVIRGMHRVRQEQVSRGVHPFGEGFRHGVPHRAVRDAGHNIRRGGRCPLFGGEGYPLPVLRCRSVHRTDGQEHGLHLGCGEGP